MPRSRTLRRIALVVLGGVLLLALLVAGLHTEFARTRVRDALLSRIDPDGTIRIGELDYSLHRLRFELRDVELRSEADTAPWLWIDRLVVELPWSALTGELAAREVIVERPRLTVFTDAAGNSNLSGESTRIERPVRIDRLVVDDLEIHWQDAAADWSVDAEAIDLEIRDDGIEASGLELGEPIRLRYGETRLDASRQTGRLGWNRVDLLLDRLVLASEIGSLSVDGRIDELLADREPELSIETTIDLEALAGMADLRTEASGAIGLSARVDGALASETEEATLRIEGTAAAPELTWAEARVDGLAADFDGSLLSPDLTLGASVAAIGWRAFRLENLRFRGGFRDALRIDELSADFADGRLEATGEIAPGESADNRLDATWTGLDLGALTRAADVDGTPVLSGRSTGSLSLGWTGILPRPGEVSGQLTASFEPGRGPLAPAGQLRATLSATGWRLDGELAVPGTGRLALRELRGQLDGDTPLTGSYELTVDDLAAAAALGSALVGRDVGAPDGLAGSGFVRGTVAGRPSDPSSSGTLALTDLRTASSAPIDLSARFEADAATLDLSELELVSEAGTVAGSLRLSLESGAVEGSIATGTGGLELTTLVAMLPAELRFESAPELAGRLGLDLTFAGTLPTPALEGALLVEDLRVGRTGPGRLDVRFRSTPEGTRIDDATLTIGPDRASVSGLVTEDGETLSLAIEVEIDDAGALLDNPELGRLREIRATADLDYGFGTGRLMLRLHELRAELADRPIRLESPARLIWDGESLVVPGLAARIDDFRLTAAGSLGAVPAAESGADPLRIELVGELDGLQEAVGVGLASWAPELRTIDLEGALSATVVLRGTLARPIPEGRLELREGLIGLDRRPPLRQLNLIVEVDSTHARLERLFAELAGATLTASGQIPLMLLPTPVGEEIADPAADLRVDFDDVGSEALAAWLPDRDWSQTRLELAGHLDLRTDTLDDPASLTGELVATTLSIGTPELSLQQIGPTRLTVEDGTLRVDSWDWSRDGSTRGLGAGGLRMEGTVGLTGDRRLDLTASGDLDLEAFAALLPPGSALAGRLELNVAVAGTVASPDATGTIEVASLTARVDSPRIALTDVSGTLTLRDRTLSAGPGLRGRINGGEAQLLAEIDLSEPTDPSGLIGLTGRTVPFRIAGVSVNSDLDLSLSLQGLDEARLFGTIRLLEGGYRTQQSLARVVRQAGSSGLTSGAAPSSESWLESVALDIQVLSDQELILDAPFVTASTSVDLRITGTAARPGVVGDLELREGGRLFLNGVRYSIERGRLQFTEPARIAPTIDLEAGTRISQYEINLSISGDAFAPSVDATSTPTLGQADVLSLMATGRTLEGASTETGQVLREQAFSMLTGQLSGVTRALGLDTVRLEQGQTLAANPFQRPDETDLFPRTTELATRLTLARNVTDWFQLAFSQNLGDTGGQSWVGTLELPWNVQFRAGTFDDDSRSLDLRHSLAFGRPPEQARRPDPARVEGVEIDGATGVSSERLREELTLDPGDTFDFIDWQRDQDRLRELLVQEGFREARVRASREAVGALGDGGRATAYVLRYEIEAGPPTRLTVSGVTLEEEALEALERTWVDAVTTEFLLGDLERVARRELIAAGWLEPTIRARLVDGEPVKEIRIEVEPGMRVARTRLRFEGNRGVASSDLRQRLNLEETLEAVWFDPERAAETVVGFYRERGWLDVQARVDLLDGEPGTRRLVVQEGPRYAIGRLTVEGASALPTEEVRAAAERVLGEPFEALTIDTAVAAVIERYLESAYNDVRVTSSTRVIEESASVALTLRVREGPLHRLADIRVRGRHRTRSGVIDRAINVRPGEPIGARAAERIRRRLGQIGAFRSVGVELASAGPPTAGEQPVRLEVSLIELPTFRLRYGLQLLDLPDEQMGRRTLPGLSALVTHENLLGVGATASVLARGRQDELFGRSSLSFPRLFGLPVRSTLLAQQSRRDISRPFDLPPISRTETVFQLSQSATIGSRIVFGYSFNYERSLAEDPISPFPAVPTVVTRLSPIAIYDSRDDLLDPSRGLFHSSTLEMALPSLGSDLTFLKYTARQSLFVPIGGAVLATSVRFGSGHSLQEGTDTLDSSEFYFAGGATTVRGYPEDSLGGTPFFGTLLPGADAVLIFNQELRFPVWSWVEGVAFFDAGSTFTSIDEIALGELPASVGAGLRLVTPYVILRLDYGHRLSDLAQLPDAPSGRFHFGIGHIF